jgi:hypothetical protein
MTDNNLYIALKAYTEGEDQYSSFAIATISTSSLAMIKENIEIVKQSKTALKICVESYLFEFIDDWNIAEVDAEFMNEIADKIESNNNFRTILNKQEYDRLSKLPVLRLATSELQIYKDGDVRAFAYTNQMTPAIVDTEFTNFQELIK